MKYLFLALGISGVMISSCGPGKKLQNANAQIETLNSQVASLNNQLSGLNAKVADNEKQITQLKKENIAYGKEAEDCRKVKEAISQKLENVNKALEEQGSSFKQIRERTADALARFKDAGADVTYKNGLVHITMQDKLLFASGSSTLRKEGEEALKVVADVLQENHRVKVIVVGHTDTDKISGKYKDNWSLSTERANTVVRMFILKYGVDPARFTSAGKSKYDPLTDNFTSASKAQNRRIEIVLNPDLSKFWEMAEDK